MPDPTDHPDYAEELAYLNRVQDRIEALLSKELRIDPGHALAYADPDAETSLRNLLSDGHLHKLQESPYFGRVDFRKGDDDRFRQFYIGREHLRDESYETLVYDWRAPISATFYQRGLRSVSIKAPDGPLLGMVSLRRQYQINRRTIQAIYDERLETTLSTNLPAIQPSRDASPGQVYADQLLLAVLDETKDGKMRDIVATIQAEQDTLIRKPLASVLLIQGAAGSGKTAVALHRLAYLLYAYPEEVRAETLLLVGPNQLFLQSIANVLPNLNVAKVKQVTFEDWAIDVLMQRRTRISRSTIIRYVEANEPLERFLDKESDQRDKVRMFRRSRLKGSVAMICLLRSYRDYLWERYVRGAAEVALSYTLPSDNKQGPTYQYKSAWASAPLVISVSEVRRLMRSSNGLNVGGLDVDGGPILNLRRAYLIDRLIRQSWTMFRNSELYAFSDTFGGEGRIEETRYRHFVKDIRPQVEKEVTEWWPHQDASTAYMNLFANGATLATLVTHLVNRGVKLSTEELPLPANSSNTTRSMYWTVEDLPVLLYLDLVLNGPLASQYSHIVIDEAQDMSPLQVAILRHQSSGNSMTLLGDIAQGVYSYRAIQHWQELEDVFNEAKLPIEHAELVHSYRSTFEITTLANNILIHPKLQAVGATPAVPVARHGPSPVLKPFASWKAMATEVMHAATTALQSGAQTAAIICKTDKLCRELANCLPSGPDNRFAVITARDVIGPGRVGIIPSYLAKGLEFDFVAVAGADAVTFSDTEYDLKLLYLALTRALHELHVYWVGQFPQALAARREVQPVPMVPMMVRQV